MLPADILANVGDWGTQSAPEHAVTAAAVALLLWFPANDNDKWLFQFGAGQDPPSRSSTMAPMMKAMQKAATRGINTSSTRRRVVGAAGMGPWYPRTLTVSQEDSNTAPSRMKGVRHHVRIRI